MRGEAFDRVLLVEDHTLLAGTLEMALRARGLICTSTSGPSVEHVLARARDLAPVLVLLDLDLGPLGAGEALIAPLREAGATVAVLTGIDDSARLANCVAAGAIGVLRKTVAFDELLAAIERASAGEPLMSAGERYALLAEARAHAAERREQRAAFEALTPREQDVLRELVRGRAVESIAADRVVAQSTIRSQVRAVLFKLGVNSQLEAVARARRAGWPEDQRD